MYCFICHLTLCGRRTVDKAHLFYTYTDSGHSIDEFLVMEGLAVAWERDGQHRDYLVGLASQARGDGVGCLW